MLIAQNLKTIFHDQIRRRPNQEPEFVAESLVESIFKQSHCTFVVVNDRQVVAGARGKARQPYISGRKVVLSEKVVAVTAIRSQTRLEVRFGLVGKVGG